MRSAALPSLVVFFFTMATVSHCLTVVKARSQQFGWGETLPLRDPQDEFNSLVFHITGKPTGRGRTLAVLRYCFFNTRRAFTFRFTRRW